jgi:hypothetical protein
MVFGLKFDNNYFSNRQGFVVDFLNNHPYFKEHKIEVYNPNTNYDQVINYGLENAGLNVPRQELIFSKEIVTNLVANCYQFHQCKVYSVETEIKENSQFFDGKNYAFDWIETIFFHLSRYEEYHCDQENNDIWDMMKEETQFLVKNRLHLEPQVDILVEIILNSLGIEIMHEKSELCISHDIDHYSKFTGPHSYIKSFLKEIIFTKRLIAPFNRIFNILFKKIDDPYQRFEFLESDPQFEKKIYFLVGKENHYDLSIPLDKIVLQRLIKKCIEKRYKIGIHPSYLSWRNKDLLASEKKLLEDILDEKTNISRQHYLHFDFARTIEILENNGIKEDSTLGFNYHYGYRCGTGFKYKLYDFETETCSTIIEDPMVLMDGSLVNIHGYDNDNITKGLNDFLDKNSRGRRININFHNSTFENMRERGLDFEKLYRLIISKFKS